MSKFCIDLEDMMLPDAIAAVVEAWYEAQNKAVESQTTETYYTVEELQNLLNRSRASVYRMINTGNAKAVNSLFDPFKLNPEFRCDIKDPIRVSAVEVKRWKTADELVDIKPKAEKANNASCKQEILNHLSKLIESKLLIAGDKMPSTRDIANLIGFHRNSVHKVYAELEKDNAILAKPGSGFYIADTNKLIPVSVF